MKIDDAGSNRRWRLSPMPSPSEVTTLRSSLSLPPTLFGPRPLSAPPSFLDFMCHFWSLILDFAPSGHYGRVFSWCSAERQLRQEHTRSTADHYPVNDRCRGRVQSSFQCYSYVVRPFLANCLCWLSILGFESIIHECMALSFVVNAVYNVVATRMHTFQILTHSNYSRPLVQFPSNEIPCPEWLLQFLGLVRWPYVYPLSKGLHVPVVL